MRNIAKVQIANLKRKIGYHPRLRSAYLNEIKKIIKYERKIK